MGELGTGPSQKHRVGGGLFFLRIFLKTIIWNQLYFEVPFRKGGTYCLVWLPRGVRPQPFSVLPDVQSKSPENKPQGTLRGAHGYWALFVLHFIPRVDFLLFLNVLQYRHLGPALPFVNLPQANKDV